LVGVLIKTLDDFGFVAFGACFFGGLSPFRDLKGVGSLGLHVVNILHSTYNYQFTFIQAPSTSFTTFYILNYSN
jgi:hypothetical protein